MSKERNQVSVDVKLTNEELLHNAVLLGEYDMSARILKAGKLDINAQDDLGRTALMIACDREQLKIVELLLKYHADPNIINKEGITALMCVADALWKSEDSIKIAAALLKDPRMQIDVRTAELKTALMLAAGSGFMAVAELLIKSGADVNKTDLYGNSPLLLAVQHQQPNVAMLLIRNGARCNVMNDLGVTLLIWASVFDYRDIAAIAIEQGVDVTACDAEGEDAFTIAQKFGNREIVEMIRPKLAHISSVTSLAEIKEKKEAPAGKEKANIEVRLNNLKEYVEECQRNIDAVKELKALRCDGSMPNLGVISANNFSRMAFLALSNQYINRLENDLEFSKISERRCEILARDNGYLSSCIEVMLKHNGYNLSDEILGFVINIKLHGLYNSLEDTSKQELDTIRKEFKEFSRDERRGLEERCRILEAVAREIVRNKENDLKTSYIACISGFLDNLQKAPSDNLGIDPRERLNRIVTLLKDYKLQLDLTAMNLSGIGGVFKEVDIDGANILLTAGQEDELLSHAQRARRNYGKIYLAAEEGNVGVIKELHKRRAIDINCMDSQGRTPLMRACMALQVKSAALLLELGASPNYRTSSGWTIIEGMARLDIIDKKSEEIINLLIKNGAQVDLHTSMLLKDGEPPRIFPTSQLTELKNGCGAIHLAVNKNHLGNVKWLYERSNAVIHLKDQDGFGPLHLACIKGYQDMVLFFIARGVDINEAAKSKARFTPLQLAISNNHLALAEVLKANGAKLQEEVSPAVQEADKDQSSSSSSWQQRIASEHEIKKSNNCHVM